MNELKTVNNLEDEYISKFLIYADVSEKSAEVYTRQLKQYFKYLSDNAVEQFARHANINTTMIYNHSIDIANNQCSNAIAQSLFYTSQKGS